MKTKWRACFRILSLSAVALLTACLLRAHAEVPRTRTFSGLVAPAFPYTPPADVGVSSEKLDWLGDEIVGWVASGELVGAELLIVKDGKAVFHEAYGWSDRERKKPVERNSIWAIQSMSKPFTATAVLMLVEEEKLSLDDPVSRYVPEFAHDDITIHHLLSHTSGFIHDGDWYDHTSPDASLDEWVEEWPHRDPEKPLGTFAYGYGWFLDDLDGMKTRPFGHGGGAGTQAIAFPDDGAIVIFLTHSRWGPHDAAFWHRLGLSGLFAHHPGYGIDGLMVWAGEQKLAEVELPAEARARYNGTYRVAKHEQSTPESLLAWEEGERLHVRLGAIGSMAGQRFHLVPLGDDRFALGRYDETRLQAMDPIHEIRFIMDTDEARSIKLMKNGQLRVSAQRIFQ